MMNCTFCGRQIKLEWEIIIVGRVDGTKGIKGKKDLCVMGTRFVEL